MEEYYTNSSHGYYHHDALVLLVSVFCSHVSDHAHSAGLQHAVTALAARSDQLHL